MLRLAVAIAIVSGLTACRKPIVNTLDEGFTVSPDAIDFGRVLQNDTATKTVTLVNTSEVPLTIDVSTAPPFAALTPLQLPGGAEVDLAVSFLAGNVLARGALVLSNADAGFTVMLSGLGVQPLDCMATAPCHQSTYDLASDRCVDSLEPDGSMCTPTSTCLEKGQCLAGACIGVPRSCDDNNLCTVDGCAEGIGCVNSPVACPTPTDPCQVATCNPNSGCGQMPAAEGTVCGAVDCMHANVCDPMGGCITIPTPDGFPCSPPTPCQAQGTCSQGMCARPPATILMPDLALPIGGAPPSGRPMLLIFGGEVFGEVCALPLDAPDAGDGGADAGNASDAGLDGGTNDGGADDGGAVLDAGAPPDGGTCALISYTENGFERFTAKFDDTRERAFVHVADPGAALLEPSLDGTTAALEVRSLADGTLRSRVAFAGAVSPGGVAADSTGRPWVLVADGDGGTHLMLVVDGGVQPLLALDASVQLLALDERGGAWVSGPSLGTAARLFSLADGGLSQDSVNWLSAPDASTFTLATTELSGVIGNRQLFDPDAGLVASIDWTDDAGEPVRVVERFSLVSSQRAVIFYKACPQPLTSCLPEQEDLRQRSFSLATGEALDDVRMAPLGVATNVVEAGLLSIAGFPPGTLTLVQAYDDAGPNAFLRLVVSGANDLSCPLLPGTEVAGATFGDSMMWVYDRRDGGPYQLESYTLGIDVSGAGWPLADGVAGQRRAR